MLDARERDVHDGHVEDQHELDQREHCQRLPPSRVSRRASNLLARVLRLIDIHHRVVSSAEITVAL
jgi:hypothetical protein